MKIDLPADQKKWLESEVASGRFASIGEAVEMAIAGLMIDEEDDLVWAKPLVDQARSSVARGDVLTGDEYFRFLDDEILKLRSR
jgi:antitoxin ParD1/3/4